MKSCLRHFLCWFHFVVPFALVVIVLFYYYHFFWHCLAFVAATWPQNQEDFFRACCSFHIVLFKLFLRPLRTNKSLQSLFSRPPKTCNVLKAFQFTIHENVKINTLGFQKNDRFRLSCLTFIPTLTQSVPYSLLRWNNGPLSAGLEPQVSRYRSSNHWNLLGSLGTGF